jgi:hypothetical protein
MLVWRQFFEPQFVKAPSAATGFVVEVVWTFSSFSHIPRAGDEFVSPTSITQSFGEFVCCIWESTLVESIVHQVVCFFQ